MLYCAAQHVPCALGMLQLLQLQEWHVMSCLPFEKSMPNVQPMLSVQMHRVVHARNEHAAPDMRGESEEIHTADGLGGRYAAF